MKNSLANTGLTLSQAQSISNICNQEIIDIVSTFGTFNNGTKKIKIDGTEYTLQVGRKIPSTLKESLKRQVLLTACQAFLMENIKAKQMLLDDIKQEEYQWTDKPYVSSSIEAWKKIDLVNEDWGWEQLTLEEVNQFLNVEAEAAVYGKFFHKNGILDNLRKELPGMAELEWYTVKPGEKTPVMVTIHHTTEELLALHKEIAELHRLAESKVNYFKAKVKNLVTLENARIENLNKDSLAAYQVLKDARNLEYEKVVSAWSSENQKAEKEFNVKKQNSIKEIAGKRIVVSQIFQSVINEFLKQETEVVQ